MAISVSTTLLIATGTLKLLCLNLAVEVKGVGGFQGSVLVLEVDKSFHDLIDFDTPPFYKFLNLGDVSLYIVEEIEVGLFLALLKLLELFLKPFIIFSWSDVNAVLLALLKNRFNISHGLFNLLELRFKWKRI